MRKVIWISSLQYPAGMSKQTYESMIPQLAHYCGGELVEFGSLFIIIGNDENKKKLDGLDKKQQ